MNAPGACGSQGVESPARAVDVNITHEELARVFEPFVRKRFSEDDPDWKRRVASKKRRFWSRLLVRWLLRWRRTPANVTDFYDVKWANPRRDSYKLADNLNRGSLWEWGNEKMLAVSRGGPRVRQLIMMRVVEATRPRTVLEVGCGSGVNLALLACRFPEILFTGLELSLSGVTAALASQRVGRLRTDLAEFTPLPLVDTSAHQRVRFCQGSAGALPFSHSSFDMVFTCVALEQMEALREQALREVHRVASRYVLMIEPFRERNQIGLSRSYVLAKDYFRGRIADLPRYGLHPVFTFTDFPQKAKLKLAAVLAEKR
jgi:ubiquinone/menaquinone biosynthesis C-methylase UbiE